MADGSPARPRRLVLLRHGRTAWNVERRGQGHAQVELDDTGHRQARAVAPAVAAMSPALIWSSDLARALQTAGYAAEATGLEVVVDDRLREYDLGERTGMTMTEYAAAHPEEYRRFRAGRYDVVPGGETTPQVVKRVTESVHAALDALAPGECGVLVGHGAALKVSVVALLGWPEEAAATLQALDNCAWVELRDSGVDGRLRLAAYNRTVV
ncbi:histidine phosphatase family protein [Nocardioides sp. GCM10027113]|uniref:histidine phosphatase family protein n=1 Tax=unclassified Nocardioides TaxID=2615069 RepID=UPI003621E172